MATKPQGTARHKRMAAELEAAGWLPLRPEVIADLQGRGADYVGCFVLAELQRLALQQQR